MPGPMRDSLSRCESNPYSLYDVQKRKVATEEKATPPIHKDTIEISKERLKKEALSRLNHTSKYLVAQQGFMRVGKYLFLGVALPPYLLLYSIPKWVLVVALPSIFLFSKNVIKKTYKQVNQTVQPFFQKFQSVVKILIQPIARLILEIRNAIQQIRQSVSAFFYGFTNILNRPLRLFKKGQEKLTGYFKQTFQNFIKGLRRNFDQAQQWMSFPTKALAALKWLKNTPKRLFEKGIENITKFNQLLKNLSNSIRLDYQTSYRLAEKIIQSIKNYWRHESEFFRAKAQKIKNLFKQKKFPLNRFKNHLKAPYEQLKNLIKMRLKRLDGYVEKGLNKLLDLSNKPFFAAEQAFSKFPKFLRLFLQPLLKSKPFQTFIQTSLKVIYYGTSMIWRLFNTIIKVIQTVTAFVKKTSETIQVYAKFIKEFGINSIKKSFAQLSLLFKFILFHFLVILILVTLILLLAIRLLAKVSARLVKS